MTVGRSREKGEKNRMGKGSRRRDPVSREKRRL